MHDVQCAFARAAVRSKDAQKQLARKSLNLNLVVTRINVTSEDVCRNIRSVKLKLNNFVFQHAFSYCHVCHCGLCAIS